eukprot:5661791-Prymnesium_polylepis.2
MACAQRRSCAGSSGHDSRWCRTLAAGSLRSAVCVCKSIDECRPLMPCAAGVHTGRVFIMGHARPARAPRAARDGARCQKLACHRHLRLLR